jgi:hypothetical protein
MHHMDFLCDDFVDMIQKRQCMTTGLTIYDYSFFLANLDTIYLAPADSMQFGRALWMILQQANDANPRIVPVHLSKIDIADFFTVSGSMLMMFKNLASCSPPRTVISL